MKLIFMGTPDFAVPTLRALHEAGHHIVGVFTQPDRPKGRGKKITASPVKELAESLNLPVFQPLKVKAPEVIETIRKLEPECIVVVAYGQILPLDILKLPPLGCVNVHASLLPSYRGPAPIHWAVLNGETKTGVTTMLMDEGLDTGDILLTAEYPISLTATTGEIHDALAELGAELLLKTLRGLQDGTLNPIPQPKEFTYAPLLKREHEKIDWSRPVQAIHNQIRGLNPWPGAYTTFRGERVKIWQSLPLEREKNNSRPEHAKPGEILAERGGGFLVQCGEGILQILRLQPEGKRQMTGADFFNGRCIGIGELFE
ncbi:MAG TPA: methionyl-tRNA formyltransferase [Peptococcaceae bacterium]|nr:methionyl-tRNA formyltransferase [Peptococcaceae bacterium]